jgi:hypothetical protein
MTYVTIPGRSRETAEALLHAAEKVGVNPTEIRTGAVGYIVPVAVSDYYQKMVRGETEAVEEEPVTEEPDDDEKSSFPDSSWKNEDIKAWAESHEVDLGDATKKADMLAAIQSADTKEE